jgi:hypothetical protein
MNTAPTLVPRKYGNKYFDMMEAPIECWPEMTQVRLFGGGRQPEGQIVEIPTVDVWIDGNFVSRRYACTPFWKIERWLIAHGHAFGFTQFSIVNSPRLEWQKDAYTEPERAPGFEGHSDADPGL